MLSKNEIREVFMANGFTIKEGQTDLKQYVYDAAYALLKRAQPAGEGVPNDDLADLVSKAMNRAWSLGQTYWQQADSEYASQNRKSDETQATFQTLIDETRAAVLAANMENDNG